MRIVSREHICNNNFFTSCKGPPGVPGVRGLRGVKGDQASGIHNNS